MRKIVIIGATSAIAQAVAKQYAKQNAEFFLVGRNTSRLQTVADDLTVFSGNTNTIFKLEILNIKSYQKCIDEAIKTLGQIDILIIAHGTLSNQKACEASLEKTLEEFQINGMSYIALLTLFGNYFEKEGKGSIVAISSCASDRGRQSNYIYGAAKSAVTTFLSGLRNRLAKKGVHVLTVKPGFVDTPMTKNFKKGLLWAKPDKVANDIVRSIDKKKDVIYTPYFWRGIMMIIKSIPEKVFKKLAL
jgi:decaprenylphospho-beta-D-erythro-pentofuranosid-2-ulose 2-reductase